jgi:hypothetical protein
MTVKISSSPSLIGFSLDFALGFPLRGLPLPVGAVGAAAGCAAACCCFNLLGHLLC